MAVPTDASSREQRLFGMLHAISRSLSGALTVPDAIVEITEHARELMDFDRIAVLRFHSPDVLRVHAAVHGVAWTEGRVMRREECSPRLWLDPIVPDRMADVSRELDPSFAMDRAIVESGSRSMLRVPLQGRGGPIGMLGFGAVQVDAFHEEDEQIASAIAGLVAMALEHERLLDEEVRRRARRTALEAVLPQLAEVHEQEAIAATLSRITKDLLPHDSVAVAVLHSGGAHLDAVLPDGQRMKVDAAPSFIEAQVQTVQPHGWGIIREVEILDPSRQLVRFHFMRGNQEQVIDLPLPPGAFHILSTFKLRSQLRVVVRRGEAVTGLILFNRRVPDGYDEQDAAVAVRIAERVSLTFAHERLEDEKRRSSEASARAEALEARVVTLQRELEVSRGSHAVVGASKSWREVLAQATRVAGTDTTVLLTGESGTGKEVVARFLHHASPRAAGPFVAINCAALPEQLLEAELFGHEKGAFTGAAAARTGRIEQAQGGVLFLDEVGEMSPSVQAKFLRVLQEREYQRLGSARVLKADVRVIAATNRDLRAAIGNGDFREDLYYRLHVFAIHLPPLRERPEDVLALADHFLKELGATLGRSAAGMTADARDALQRYAWPGNARELRNVIERALILSDGGLVHPSHLAFSPTSAGNGRPDAVFDAVAQGPLPERGVDLEAIERSLVQRAIAQVSGNKSKAARLLGLTRAQLYSRIEKYQL